MLYDSWQLSFCTVSRSDTQHQQNILLPLIIIKYMANSTVFIVMVTHQWAFTPHMHLQAKALWKLYSVMNYQLLCLCKSTICVFLIFVGQVQGLKTAFFLYKPKMLFPSENSANWFLTAQDSYCTAQTKENSLMEEKSWYAAEARNSWSECGQRIFANLLYSGSWKSTITLITVVLIHIQWFRGSWCGNAHAVNGRSMTTLRMLRLSNRIQIYQQTIARAFGFCNFIFCIRTIFHWNLII